MQQTTVMQTKIKTQINRSGLSVREVERLAGLKRCAVSNIIEGKSKSPSMDTLRAIGKVLNCPLSDLLEIDELEKESQKFDSRKQLFIPLKLSILHETMDIVYDCFKRIEVEPDVDRFWQCVKEVYSYTLGSENDKIDYRFAEWFVEKFKE